MYLQVLECERNHTIVQTAWNYMNDALRTNVFVKFQPETIACACIYLAARALQISLPSRPQWFLLFGATEEDIQEICLTTLKLYTRKKPNYELVEKEVEKRKAVLQEAKLKAKGLNPDGAAAVTSSSFSPASKQSSPREVKTEKTPELQNVKNVKEPEDKQQNNKSPFNGIRKESKRSRSRSGSRSRSRSRSHSPRRHYNNRRSHSGTYSSRSRSRSRSHSASPHRYHKYSPSHYKSKHRNDMKSSSRHGHKRKKSQSRSRSRSRSRDYIVAVKKHRHDRGHHRDRRERSPSYEKSHKVKHHGSSHNSHAGHRHRH